MNDRELLARYADTLSWAWTIICNAGEGDWTRESAQWRTAAEKFRDTYHTLISQTIPSESAAEIGERYLRIIEQLQKDSHWHGNNNEVVVRLPDE